MPHRTIASVLAAALACAGARLALADSFALIGNAKEPTAKLSRSDVKALYTGKAKTLGGSAAIVVIRPEADAPFTQFVDQVFGIPTKTLLAKIHQEVFKGEMTTPLKATSDDDVVRLVSGAPGTLGVVSAEAAGHLPTTVHLIGIGG